MKKSSLIPTIVFSFLLTACASAPATADVPPEEPAFQPGEPVFTLTIKNPDDQIGIEHADGTALIDIQSPSGIGSATFELEAGVMPTDVTLRLHLTGLEDIRLTAEQVAIGASISSGEEPNISQRILSAGTESSMLPGNPLWMEIDIVSEGGGQGIPLEEGYFELDIPREFLQKAGTSFTVEWIDFYR